MNLSFPWPNPNLSPNARSRTHWKRTRAIKAYRTGCGWEAKTQGARRIEADSLSVVITFHPPDRRHRDRDNMIASFKSGQDGIADVIGVDDSKWVTTYHIGEPVKFGRVVVSIPEVDG